MHVITSAPQIARFSPIDQLCFVAPTKEMPPVPMPPVKSLRVGAQQPFHPSSQIWLRRLQNQMKMIAHQTVGIHLPPALLAGNTQGLEKALSIQIIPKNLLPAGRPGSSDDKSP